MKIDNKIILYFDNQLSEKEKIQFEKEIENSSELQKQVEDYKSFLSEITNTKDIKTDDSYFVNIIPNFRTRIAEKEGRRFNPKIIYVLSTVAAVIILFFVFINRDNNVDSSLQNIISNMNEQELTQTLNELPDVLPSNDSMNFIDSSYDSILNSMIADELNITNNSPLNLFSENSDLNNLYNDLSDNEADILYNELSNKKFY